MEKPSIDVTVVYDNFTNHPDLRNAHGFSCIIDGLEKTILFDAGGDGEILLHNLSRLGRSPGEIDIVFLSHGHWDHSGGLFTFLHRNPDVTVFVPAAVSRIFRDHVKMLGARVVVVEEPVEICTGAWSTGELGGKELENAKHEQAIVLETGGTVSVLTGCAHPGIAAITDRATELRGRVPDLVAGGFHLMDSQVPEVEAVIAGLKGRGVKRIGASHCTGEKQIAQITRILGDDYVKFGCGAVVRLAA